MRGRVLVVVAVVVVLVAAGVFALTRGGSSPTASSTPKKGQTGSIVEPTIPQSSMRATPTEAPDTSACPSRVQQVFEPATMTVAGIPGRITVITPPRDAANVPGVPPLTSTGKQEFAFDREQDVLPGDLRGNVLLNAHTYPDGSALGNKLLATLRTGMRIVAHSDTNTNQKLCYRVTQRVEVLASQGYPAYYSRTGKPQLAIIVCSGRRLGSENWEKRTIWFASPSH